MSSIASSNAATTGSSTSSTRSSTASSPNQPGYITGTQAFSNYMNGIAPLTPGNLAKYTTPKFTITLAYHGAREVDKLRAGARSLDFELPLQAEREVLQRYQQPTPMHRFQQGHRGHAAKKVSPDEWTRLVRQDPLAADIEAEYRAIRKRRTRKSRS